MNLVELALFHDSESGVTLPAHPVYDQLPELDKINAGQAASRLVLCGDMGLYNPLSARKLVDFGAGRGGSTFVLGLLAEQNRGSVDAVEVKRDRFSRLASVGLEGQMPVRLHRAEGIRWLHARARKGERFDLITAAMLGPDFDGVLARKLLLASRKALEPGGSMIVFSDPLTMDAAQTVCEAEGADFQGLERLAPDLSTLPDAIVVTNS